MNSCKYKKYKYYRSIEFLPIIWFFKTLETGDLRYLLKLKDYEILPDRVNLEPLKIVWSKIESDYGKEEDSNSSIIQYTLAKSIHKMELEYLMLWNIYNLMAIDHEGNEAKKILKYAGLDLTPKQIEKKLKTLKNKINLKRESIKDQSLDNEKIEFYRVIDEIENIRGRSIDIYTTTVKQYIAIKKNIKHGKRQDTTEGRN